MTEEDYCELCDLKLSECVHGRPPSNPVEDRPVLGTIIVAKYKGTCHGCEEAIEVGDHIGQPEDSDGLGDWYHYGCGR